MCVSSMPGQCRDLPATVEFLARRGHPRDGEIQVRGIGVVRDRDHFVAFHHRASHQFRRHEHAVTEKRMGMKIDHVTSLMIFQRCFNVSAITTLRGALLPLITSPLFHEGIEVAQQFAACLVPDRRDQDLVGSRREQPLQHDIR